MITYCDVIPNCTDCPRYGDDCDGDKRVKHTDLISRADAIEVVRKCVVESELLADWNKAMESAQELLSALPSADAVQGYTEWLEKIIVDNEGANEWLCEDTPDLEWCEKNCHYSSIQAECLRHLYEVSKGGGSE